MHPVLLPICRGYREPALDQPARGLELHACDRGLRNHYVTVAESLAGDGYPGSLVLPPHTEVLLVAFDVDPVAVHGNIPTTRVKGSACVTSGSPSSRSRRLVDSACTLMRRGPVQAQAVASWGRSAMISSRPGSCRRRRHPQCVAGLDQRGDGVLRRDEIALAPWRLDLDPVLVLEIADPEHRHDGAFGLRFGEDRE